MLRAPRQAIERSSLWVCRCIRIRHKNTGTTYNVTTWDSTVTVPWPALNNGAVTFTPGQIVEVKEQRRALDFQDSSFNFTIRVGETFPDELLESQALVGGAVWVAMVDPMNAHNGYYWMHAYSIEAIVRDGPAATIECVGMTAPLQERVGHLWGVTCRNRFLDAHCNAQNDLGFNDLLARSLYGSVTAVQNRQRFTVSLTRSLLTVSDAVLRARMTNDQQFFWAGAVRFTAGGNNSDQRFGILRTGAIVLVGDPGPITEVRIEDIQLIQVPGQKVQLNQAVTVQAGCDQRNETCRDRWHNSANFRGAAATPGSFDLMITPEAT